MRSGYNARKLRAFFRGYRSGAWKPARARDLLAVQAVSSEPVSRGHIPCSLGKNREFQRKQGFWSDERCEKTRQPSVLEVEFPMPSNREFFPTEQGISAKDQGPKGGAFRVARQKRV